MERPKASRATKAFLLVLLLLVCTTSGRAQGVHTVDLAKNMDGSLKETVDAGSYTVVIQNKLPQGVYDITCIKSTQVIDAFTLDPLKSDSIRPSNDKVKSACDLLLDRILRLDALKSESALRDTLALLRKALNNPESKCEADTRKELLEQILHKTEETLQNIYKLKDGEMLTIIVSRKDGEKTHTWTHVLSTQPRGQWSVTYGFSFITDLLTKEHTYFAKQQPDTTLYTLTKKNSKAPLNFVPCVLMSWIPTNRLDNNWAWAVTGGLGFDLANPVVFLGGSGIFNSNLGIHLGFAAHKQDRLNGIYSPGETVKENLTSEQVNEQVYAVNPFVCISFRFKSSPFTTK